MVAHSGKMHFIRILTNNEFGHSGSEVSPPKCMSTYGSSHCIIFPIMWWLSWLVALE